MQRGESEGNEHRSAELQLILELEDLQSSLSFCEVTEGEKQSKHFYSSMSFQETENSECLNVGLL